MQNLKITLVQAKQIWEDKQANIANYDRLLSSHQCGDLVLLPEMFQTAFTMNNAALAETMNDSEGIQWLKETAKKYKAAFYTSLIIKDGDYFFNRGVFVEPNGKVTSYDKRKTFGLAGEDKFYRSGNNEVIVEYKNWRIMLQICYDLRFPEIVRNRINPDGNPAYDLVLYVANWPETRKVHWSTLLQARAIENQCYAAGVNRVGEAPNQLSYSGNSQVVDLLGNVTALTASQEEIMTIELNSQNLIETRAKLPFLKDAQF